MIDRDTIIKLAREAGMEVHERKGEIRIGSAVITGCNSTDQVMRFAALVAAAEREQCADIVENADTPDCGGWTAQGIADDIRARSNHA